MSSPLDRIEAALLSEIGVCRYNKNGSPYLPKEQAKEYARALVNVAKAAERVDKQIWGSAVDADEYHQATVALREALAALNKEPA